MSFLSESLQKTWKYREIRGLVLLSLCLQITLILFANHRRRSTSRRLIFSLWAAYLLADTVATFTLGTLSDIQRPGYDTAANLFPLWCPFLLLHLGGPDNITSFSQEDNELWRRHLLGLMFQIGLALYVFIKSRPRVEILAPAILMFAAAILKYGERTWSLWTASMDRLRSSMITAPEPGPNYANFMEYYVSKYAAGVEVDIIAESEYQTGPEPTDQYQPIGEITYMEKISEAHRFSQTFRRYIVDLILTFKDRADSQSFFLQLKPEDAFEVIAIELSFIYELLHTKAPLVRSILGGFLRATTFTFTLTSLILFHFTAKHDYKTIDISITYVLLGGAIVLEMYSCAALLLSEGRVAQLKNSGHERTASRILKLICYFQLHTIPWWSNSMWQYNLISLCLKQKPTRITPKSYFLGLEAWDMKASQITSSLGLRDTWEKFRYVTRTDISPDVKELVFDQLKSKVLAAKKARSFKDLSSCRGDCVLKEDKYKNLRWSVEVELDESILIWHLATDLCYYEDNFQDPNTNTKMTPTKTISDYMLFLLVVRPFMLTAGIGQIRYGDTCAEVKKFFLGSERMRTEVEACEMLLGVETAVPPSQVKGDRSKSVLFDGCRLAKDLRKLEVRERWTVISMVWAEILCYAASKCRGDLHARQLSSGGELLSHVWFLMGHLGIGEQYRIEAGDSRVKLKKVK